jgi:Zn-dependent protease
MKVRGGWLTISRMRGAPVRVHWSTPVAILILSRFALAPLAWAAAAALILVHEIGHAILVWRFKYEVVSIDISGVGGRCVYAGDPTRWEASAIAWGGVLAQSAVLVAALAVNAIGILPASMGDVFLVSNALLIALNLLPIPPLDGELAWHLPIAYAADRGWRIGRRK